MELTKEEMRIDVVGMQPLSRPGCQSAYVFRIEQGENFNTLAQFTLFRHDAAANRQIYEHANEGNQLFPQELIGTRIRREIVKGEEFSEQAFKEAKRRYAPALSDETLKGYLTDKYVTISTIERQWFSEVEKKEAVDYWETYQQELFCRINVRWSYRGSIEFVISAEMRA